MLQHHWFLFNRHFSFDSISLGSAGAGINDLGPVTARDFSAAVETEVANRRVNRLLIADCNVPRFTQSSLPNK